MARVQFEDRINGKFGYINPKGEIVIPPNFEEATDFRGGQAQVRINGKTQTIDLKGKALE